MLLAEKAETNRTRCSSIDATVDYCSAIISILVVLLTNIACTVNIPK